MTNMPEKKTHTFFTVIIPTRNRPELFKQAIDSVLSQSYKDIEIIVVNDGSTDEHTAAYKKLESDYGNNVYFHYQVRRPNGHGQSYSMNSGAYSGTGEYLCFLDDDDLWTDHSHLQRAHDAIKNSTDEIDAYYSNQEAFFSNGRKQENNVWIEDLTYKIRDKDKDTFGCYIVDARFLFSSGGFAHLNCSIIRRDLYIEIKGMDENIRYECDRDIYNRTVDAAKTILYCPNITSKHHIPDPKKSDNMSTLVSDFEKRLYQTTVYEKAILLSKNECINFSSKIGLSDVFKHITTILLSENKTKDAEIYAKKALALNCTFKWWAFCQYLAFKSKLGL